MEVSLLFITKCMAWCWSRSIFRTYHFWKSALIPKNWHVNLIRLWFLSYLGGLLWNNCFGINVHTFVFYIGYLTSHAACIRCYSCPKSCISQIWYQHSHSHFELLTFLWNIKWTLRTFLLIFTSNRSSGPPNYKFLYWVPSWAARLSTEYGR